MRFVQIGDVTMDIRTLRADEIDCRINKVTEKGCILLLYKDALDYIVSLY